MSLLLHTEDSRILCIPEDKTGTNLMSEIFCGRWSYTSVSPLGCLSRYSVPWSKELEDGCQYTHSVTRSSWCTGSVQKFTYVEVGGRTGVGGSVGLGFGGSIQRGFNDWVSLRHSLVYK